MQKKNKYLALIFIIFSSMSLTSNFVLAGEGDTLPVNVNQVIEFEQYPVEIISAPSNKKSILTTKLAKQYKTVITNAMQELVNFAGHFRVVTWGCGTDCRGFAIVDKVSGVTYSPTRISHAAFQTHAANRRVNSARWRWCFGRTERSDLSRRLDEKKCQRLLVVNG